MRANLKRVNRTSLVQYSSVILWHLKLLLSNYFWRVSKVVFLEIVSVGLTVLAVFSAGVYLGDQVRLVQKLQDIAPVYLSNSEIIFIFPAAMFLIYVAGVMSAYGAATGCIKIGAMYTGVLRAKIFSVIFKSRNKKLVGVPNDFDSTLDFTRFAVSETRSGFVFGRLLASSLASVLVLPIVAIGLFFLNPIIATVSFLLIGLGVPFYMAQSRDGAAARKSTRKTTKNLIEGYRKKIDAFLVPSLYPEPNEVNMDAREAIYEDLLAQQRLVIERSGFVSNFASAVVVFIFLYTILIQESGQSFDVAIAVTTLFLIRIFFVRFSRLLKAVVAVNRFFPNLYAVYKNSTRPSGSDGSGSTSANSRFSSGLTIVSAHALRENSAELSRVMACLVANCGGDGFFTLSNESVRSGSAQSNLDAMMRVSFDNNYYNEILRCVDDVYVGGRINFNSSWEFRVREEGLVDEETLVQALHLLFSAVACGARVFLVDEVFEPVFSDLVALKGVFRGGTVIVLAHGRQFVTKSRSDVDAELRICCSEMVRGGFREAHICRLRSRSLDRGIDNLDLDD